MGGAARLRLLGRVAVQGPAGVALLGTSQARQVLAFLALAGDRPVPRDELADLLWPGAFPAHWAGALRGVVANVRSFLTGSEVASEPALPYEQGAYRLQLVESVEVDVVAALAALDLAEAGLAQCRAHDALTAARLVADELARPFLAGDCSPWLDEQRARLLQPRVRALQIQTTALLALGQTAPAVSIATDAIRLDPTNEASHRSLMEAHRIAGNPAAALRAYEQCRIELAERLGLHPAPATEAVYRLTLGRAESTEPPPGGWRTDVSCAAEMSERLRCDGDRAIGGTWEAASRAAALAAERFAYGDATDHYARACSLAEADGASAADRIEIELGWGAALRRAGRLDEARETLERALSRADVAGASELGARITLELVGGGGRGVCPDLDDAGRADLLTRALSALAGRSLSLRVQVMAELALALLLIDHDRCLVLAAAAHDLARASGHTSDRARAMIATRLMLMMPSQADRRLAATSSVITRPANGLTSELLARMLMWRMVDQAELGDRVSFEQDLATFTELTGRLDQPYWHWIAAGWRTTQALIDGDLALAEARANEALLVGPGADHPEVSGAWGGHLMVIRILQGRLGELCDEVGRLAGEQPTIPTYRAAHAAALSQAGDLDGARRILDAFAEPGLAAVARDTNWSGTVGALAEATVMCGHRSLAEQMLAELPAQAERMVVMSFYGSGAVYFGPFSYHLGRLAALVGDDGSADVWLTDAQARATAFGAPLFAERARAAREGAAAGLSRSG